MKRVILPGGVVAVITLALAACAPGATGAAPEQSPVSVPISSSDPTPPAPRPSHFTAAVLLVRSPPAAKDNSPPAVPEGFRALRLLPEVCAPLLADTMTADTPYEKVAQCLEEHAIYLPLACWVSDGWVGGEACLRQLPRAWRSQPKLPVRCTHKKAGEAWVHGVAIALQEKAPVLVASESAAPSVSLVSAPMSGEGLDVPDTIAKAVLAAVERDLGRPWQIVMVTQSLEANFVGDPKPERLLNVAVMALPHPTRNMTSRSFLYLFSGQDLPVALASTTGEQAGEHFDVVASTDLNGDGRQELVLHRFAHQAPVDTALVAVTTTKIERVSAWDCTELGLVSTR